MQVWLQIVVNNMEQSLQLSTHYKTKARICDPQLKHRKKQDEHHIQT